jgi:hypothetical protein
MKASELRAEHRPTRNPIFDGHHREGSAQHWGNEPLHAPWIIVATGAGLAQVPFLPCPAFGSI